MARQEAPRTRSHFTFYAAGGRMYARNPDGKLIDLGRLARQPDGSWHYRLDGNQLAGGGTSTPEAALADAAARMGFLYLDGQFTAVAPAGDADLHGAPAIELDVDELPAAEPMQDARA